MSRLAGKVAVVTGAASGIGRALADGLAARGCRLAIADIDEAGLRATAGVCRERGVEVDARPLDVRDREAVEAWAAAVADRFGVVHLVVNNAGVALVAEATQQRWEDLDHVLDVNLWGVLHGSQAFLPALIRSGDGQLVNISSVFGLIGVPTQSAYNASKFAVRGYTEALAAEMRFAGHPVVVSCVHPGGVDTDIAASAQVRGGRDRARLADYFERFLASTSPERAAAIILRGVERRRARILVGWDAWGIHLMERILGARSTTVLGLVTRPFLRS